jgi:hypothetical protein
VIKLIKKEKMNWIFLGLFISGLIITIQSFFIQLYLFIISNGHRIDFLSSFISTFSNLFGFKSSVNNGIVFLQTNQNLIPFTTTFEKLGFFLWFNIFIGAIILFFLFFQRKRMIKYIVFFFAFSLFYLIFRFTFLIHLYTQSFFENDIFWDPFVFFITFIPFCLILMKFANFNKVEFKNFGLKLNKKFANNKKIIISSLLIFVLVFSLIGSFVFQDPGVKKDGKILIDELHSDWENTTKAFDKEWYGQLSTYNFYSWYKMLDLYYDVDININNSLTAELLDDYDVLILKCPTNSYTSKETDSIVKFVKNGGGLYLIGDHTNVFGMNYYLNQVSEEFGITFNSDSTHVLGTGRTSKYKTPELFPHPIIQNMDEFDFLTSCTLNVPLTSENVILGNKLLSQPGSYSTEDFFREYGGDLDIEYGCLLQVAALKYEKGRIVAFTDSTCFSNFCIFMDGYENFNLGTIEYLNRENSYNFVNILLIVLVIILIPLSIYLLRSNNKISILSFFVIIGLFTFSIASPFYTYLNELNYPLPEAKKDYDRICFDLEHSNILVTTAPFARLGSDYNFNVFFMWTQRVDLFPSLENDLSDAILKGDAIVIINPHVSFTLEEINLLKDYVSSGGYILLMDTIENEKTTANELLEQFGLKIRSTKIKDHKLYDYYNSSNNATYIGNISSVSLEIIGGQKVFLDENNQSHISINYYGKGKVVAVVDSYSFSDKVMGGAFTVPDKNLRNIYNTEYYIFEELLFDK